VAERGEEGEEKGRKGKGRGKGKDKGQWREGMGNLVLYLFRKVGAYGYYLQQKL
jgi:hypothetical protein